METTMKKPEIGQILPFSEVPGGVVFRSRFSKSYYQKHKTDFGIPVKGLATLVYIATRENQFKIADDEAPRPVPFEPDEIVEIDKILPPEYRFTVEVELNKKKKEKHFRTKLLHAESIVTESHCSIRISSSPEMQILFDEEAHALHNCWVSGIINTFAYLGVYIEPPVWPEE